VKFPAPFIQVGSCIARCKGKHRYAPKTETYQKDDYVRIIFNGERWSAHRLSFSLNVEKIPRRPNSKKEGLVLHTCDNKWCINPDHLYLGTSKQNAIDNAERNIEWRRKRSEIQKRIGAPKESGFKIYWERVGLGERSEFIKRRQKIFAEKYLSDNDFLKRRARATKEGWRRRKEELK